ncbi:type VI secretion system baseplate subunit TssF, partial [Archangium sp.]|uniref:type VI secretion system baseplate subunit TssF n=1 Tax=Archangium sp. TaxID=1872627 RepID=UPI002ED78962
MADSQDALRLAYQRELDYLRRMGARFAEDHPKIASRLQLTEDRAADPHVERLLESFAFLTARVQKGFEDELPEVTTQLLGLLYPHFVEPVPSLAIARFEVDPQRKPPASGYAVPRHTLLYAETEQGHTCRFRTCYPVTLWPVELTEARLESTSRYDFLERRTDVAAVLRLRLEARGVSFSELELERLPLYLGGERRTAHTLYELLTCNLRGVVLVPDPDGHTRAPVHLPADSVHPLGFGRDEEVLPAHPQSHAGHRLLQEYFAFPDKFLFFELAPGNAHVRTANRVLDVLLLLDALPQGRLALTPDSFSLGCTPIA